SPRPRSPSPPTCRSCRRESRWWSDDGFIWPPLRIVFSHRFTLPGIEPHASQYQVSPAVAWTRSLLQRRPRLRFGLGLERPDPKGNSTQLPHGFAEHVQARTDVGARIVRIGLIFDCKIAGKLHLAQRPQDARHIKDAAAKDDVGAAFVVMVLQVHAEVT